MVEFGDLKGVRHPLMQTPVASKLKESQSKQISRNWMIAGVTWVARHFSMVLYR